MTDFRELYWTFNHSLNRMFKVVVCQSKRKSHLNRHCISALDTPGRGLILALIQSHNNRGEIPLQVQQTSCLCRAPTQSNRNLVFHNIAALPPSFSFSKGQNPSKKQHLCFATCECVVHPFHFPVPLQDSELANSLCYRFRSIFFFPCRVFKTSHPEKKHLLTNRFRITLLDDCARFYKDNYCSFCGFITNTSVVG